MKSLAFSLFLAAVIGLAVWSYGSRDGSQELEAISIGMPGGTLYETPFWVAEENGYFKAEGLYVTLREYESGGAAFRAMLAGDPIDIVAHAPTPFAAEAFRRDDFALLAAYATAADSIKMVADAARGITSVGDLRGKRIGVSKGTAGEYLLDLVLSTNALAASETKLFDIAPNEMPRALERGNVDAIVTWEPHIADAKELLGPRAVELGGAEAYREVFLLSTMRRFAEERIVTIEKFLRAILRAERFIKENSELAREAAVRHLPPDAAAVFRATWQQFGFELSLDQSLLAIFSDQGRWLRKKGLIVSCCSAARTGAEFPAYPELFSSDALRAVKPEAVTIIR